MNERKAQNGAAVDARRAAGARVEVLVFELGEHRFALRAPDVSELLRAVTVVPLPEAPPVIEGVINVRGAVVPVLDLRARFRLPARPIDPRDHLILSWAGERLVAIRADRAVALEWLEADAIEAPADIASGTRALTGIAKVADGLLLIQDLRAFLTQTETGSLDEALLASSRPEGA